MSDFQEHLARQCATGRLHFGPGERSKGVREHIMKEFDEIDKEDTAAGRAKEWTDVAILGIDGFLRAVRQMLREQYAGETVLTTEEQDVFDVVLVLDGEPTNDFVAATAMRMLVAKQHKNELRDFGDWRQGSEDHAMEHKRGIHD